MLTVPSSVLVQTSGFYCVLLCAEIVLFPRGDILEIRRLKREDWTQIDDTNAIKFITLRSMRWENT